MLSEEMKENIKRHYGSSDEDLQDLGVIMDALADLDKVEDLKRTMETMKLENDQALKKLDDTWRTRYRERFFDGDVSVPDLVDIADPDEEDPADITLEDYLNGLQQEKN